MMRVCVFLRIDLALWWFQIQSSSTIPTTWSVYHVPPNLHNCAPKSNTRTLPPRMLFLGFDMSACIRVSISTESVLNGTRPTLLLSGGQYRRSTAHRSDPPEIKHKHPPSPPSPSAPGTRWRAFAHAVASHCDAPLTHASLLVCGL
eukprot:3222597-Rhodomonas_salina.3